MKSHLTGQLHKLPKRPPGPWLAVGMLVSIFGLALLASPNIHDWTFTGQPQAVNHQPVAVKAEQPEMTAAKPQSQQTDSRDFDPTELTQKLAVSGFVENKGQLVDQYGNPNNDVHYLLHQNGLNVQLRATGFSYDTYIREEVPLTDAEKAHLARPLTLRFIHGNVSMLQQPNAVFTVLRKSGDTNAGRNVQHVPLHIRRFG